MAGTLVARHRILILAGFAAASAGYFWLSGAPTALLCVAALVVAHAGGSAAWTSSTTMLQEMTEDKFRGRVFSAEFAVMMFLISVSSLAAGRAVDAGIPVRTVAAANGVILLVPVLTWLAAQRLWRPA